MSRSLVGIDAFGVGKPDARIFRRACEVLGPAPAEAAYVGDELDVDARGARDAGLSASGSTGTAGGPGTSR